MKTRPIARTAQARVDVLERQLAVVAGQLRFGTPSRSLFRQLQRRRDRLVDSLRQARQECA